jgi:hypothetical protein
VNKSQEEDVADGDGGSSRPRSGMESNLLRQVNAAGISIHASAQNSLVISDGGQLDVSR